MHYLKCLPFPIQHNVGLVLVIMCSYRLFWWILLCGCTQFIYLVSVGEGVSQVDNRKMNTVDRKCKGPEAGIRPQNLKPAPNIQ